MADQNKRTKISPRTPAMESLLSVGYGGMTVKRAETILAERKKDPATWPYSEAEKAEAFLAAYNSDPQVISKRVGSTLRDKPELMEA